MSEANNLITEWMARPNPQAQPTLPAGGWSEEGQYHVIDEAYGAWIRADPNHVFSGEEIR